MAESMREKIARALCVASGHDPDGPTMDIHVPGDPHAGEPWAGFRSQADVVLDALMEPTVAMKGIGSEVRDQRPSEAGEVFVAMIKAAKDGK